MCDTFVILPEFTSSNTFFFGKNSDRDPNEAQEVVIIPAKEFAKGESLKCTYITIPQAARINKIILSKPVWIWGAEMGVNEHGVVIGNEAVFPNVPAGKEPGLIGMDYLRLGLERGNSAEAAMDVITSLLERYGQSGNCGFTHPFYYNNSFIIADSSHAWKLETYGKEWVAEEIMQFGSISNRYSIESKWDRISAQFLKKINENKRRRKNDPINIKELISDRIFTHFSDSKKRESCTYNKIKETGSKISTIDLFNILRTHDIDVEYSPDRGITGSDVCMHAGFGPIRKSQTTGSMVVEQSNGEMIIWMTGSSSPCLSQFKPMSLRQDFNYFGPAPDVYYDDQSYWWQQERIHRLILKDYKKQSVSYIDANKKLEDKFLERVRQSDDLLDTIADCFDEAWLFQKEWLERLGKQRISHQTNFLYRSAWKKNNNLAKFPQGILQML